MKYKYYKIIDSKKDFKGERYFRVDEDKESVLQVVLENGNTKRSKNNLIGIYRIKYISFTSNYFFPNNNYNYVDACSSVLFFSKMKECYNLLYKY